MTEPSDKKTSAAAAVLASEEFSLNDAIGGWRGLIESVVPGIAFVTSFVIVGGFKVPTIAALSAVAILVVVRLVQGTPVTQALSGLFGVGLGAVWAWRAGEASAYFVPGLWLTGAFALGVLISMLVRWPAAGVVVALLKGWDSSWRSHPGIMRRMQWASGVYAVSQIIRLAVQVPLYLADATAVLGGVKLAMGAPLLALTLWVMWLMVRNAELPPAPQDQPQQR